MGLRIRKIHFKCGLAIFAFFLGEPSYAGSQDVYKNLKNLAAHSKAEKDNGRSKYFFHDVSDSIDFYFGENGKIFEYDGKGFSASSRTPKDQPLCADMPIDNKIKEKYNSQKTSQTARKNFWKATAACLAAREGALYVVTGQASQFSKLDRGTGADKYIYGYYQLSTENGASVDAGCQQNWKNFKIIASKSGAPSAYLQKQATIPALNDLGSGKTETADSMAALGTFDKQRFNVNCGIHEIFRGAFSTHNGKSCLNPFKKNGNRYNAFRNGSTALKYCINQTAPVVMPLGTSAEDFRNAVDMGRVPEKLHDSNHQ